MAEQFTKLTTQVLLDERLSGNAKLAFAVLRHHDFDGDLVVRIGFDRIGKILGRSRGAARRAVNELIGSGYVEELDFRNGQCPRYRLLTLPAGDTGGVQTRTTDEGGTLPAGDTGHVTRRNAPPSLEAHTPIADGTGPVSKTTPLIKLRPRLSNLELGAPQKTNEEPQPSDELVDVMEQVGFNGDARNRAVYALGAIRGQPEAYPHLLAWLRSPSDLEPKDRLELAVQKARRLERLPEGRP